jgi:hypothetical protein
LNNRRASRFTKNFTPLIIATFFAALLTGCSKHSQTAEVPKVTDLGIIAVSNGVPSSHIIADGRVCVMTPTLLPGGHQIELATSISNTDAAGTRHVYSLTTYFTPDQATTFSFDSNDVIRLTLHIP